MSKTDHEKIETEERSRKKSIGREIWEYIRMIIIVVAVVILAQNFLIINAKVPTESMVNTIMVGDQIFGNRLAYKFGDPQRFDIVIFKYPDDEKQLFIKRIIGLPGEKVDILNGTVYITGADGKTLELRDDFVSEENKDNYSGSFVVPEDCYFVMGDNRDNSVDSRYWVTTNYVSRDKFIGKVMFRYYPFKTAGKLE